MASLARALVSKKKRRLRQDGFNLDLTYVTRNIIAMGFPSQNLEAMFRNPMKEVVKFLDLKHYSKYWVYNLCSERSYDPEFFYGRVSTFPFEDHQALPLELIGQFCKHVETWLSLDIENVAVVHCKAGKGRTGLMICAYLLYSRSQPTADLSLSYYGTTRTKNAKGVTLPCQRRYVYYFGDIMNRGPPKYEAYLLKGLKMSSVPKGWIKKNGAPDVWFRMRWAPAPHQYKVVFSGRDGGSDGPAAMDSSSSAASSTSTPTTATTMNNASTPSSRTDPRNRAAHHLRCTAANDRDLLFEFDHEEFYLPMIGDYNIIFSTGKKKAFYIWFNTCFAKKTESGFEMVFTKPDIDKVHKDKNHKLYPADFAITVQFVAASPELNRLMSSYYSQLVTGSKYNAYDAWKLSKDRTKADTDDVVEEVSISRLRLSDTGLGGSDNMDNETDSTGNNINENSGTGNCGNGNSSSGRNNNGNINGVVKGIGERLTSVPDGDVKKSRREVEAEIRASDSAAAVRALRQFEHVRDCDDELSCVGPAVCDDTDTETDTDTDGEAYSSDSGCAVTSEKLRPSTPTLAMLNSPSSTSASSPALFPQSSTLVPSSPSSSSSPSSPSSSSPHRFGNHGDSRLPAPGGSVGSVSGVSPVSSSESVSGASVPHRRLSTRMPVPAEELVDA